LLEEGLLLDRHPAAGCSCVLLELVEDPVRGSADPAVGIGLRRERAAGSERDQLLDCLLDPVGTDVVQHLPDLGRDRWPVRVASATVRRPGCDCHAGEGCDENGPNDQQRGIAELLHTYPFQGGRPIWSTTTRK